MKLKFDKGYLKTNSHGTQKKGEPWNRETVRGWKVRLVRLETFVRVGNSEAWKVQSLIGWRLIIYRPSGAWWTFDAYLSMTEPIKQP